MMTDDIVHGGTETDCAVGTIVWVRRRNGSWWPGRILGPNELSASHLMSPRSGTPVKLLGREDASVDWYNLEKSKRVKAFRCGEFDDCIERAESSQGAPIKKREKYARREDAILHALELERQLLEKRQQKQEVGSNPATDSDTGAIKKKITGSCDSNLKNDLSEDNPKHANTKSTMDSPLHGQKSKPSKLLSLEEVNAEVTPRMRGLQDFGLRTAPKKTFSKSVSANNVVHVVPSGEHSVTNFTSVTKCSLSIKKKRSHGVLNEDYHVKRKDKRRPLIQVMQSTAKVANSVHSGQDETDQMGAICRAKRSKCVYLPADSNDCPDHLEFSCQSEIPQSQLVLDNGFEQPITLTEGKTSSDLMEDSSSTEDDFLGPNTSETAVTYQEVSQTLEEFGEPRRPDNSIGVSEQPENTTDDELDESGFSTFIPRFHHPGQAAASNTDVEVSKWQLKGKRNNRSLSKKHMDALEKKVLVSSSERSNGSARGTNHQDKQKRIVDVPSQRSWHDFYQRNDEFVSGYDEEDLAEDMLEDRRYAPVVKKNLIDWGFSNTSVTSSDEGSPSTWEMDKQTPLKGYWENSCFDPIYVGHQGGVYGPMLFEVDLKVQASYHGEHVPLVSLMSRLNGKAIVGHPLQIEILVDGSSHLLLSESGVCSLLPSNDDENAPLTPVWRTARRTTMHRVPRSHPSSTIDGEEAEPQYMDPEISHPYRKSYGGNYDLKTRLVKRSLSHGRRSSAGKKFQKKLLKKVTLSSKKTRTLSSFAMDQKVDGNHSDAKLSGKHDGFEGSIKSEPKAPLVTCIPVKLAFSRITEAIGRSSSSAMGK